VPIFQVVSSLYVFQPQLFINSLLPHMLPLPIYSPPRCDHSIYNRHNLLSLSLWTISNLHYFPLLDKNIFFNSLFLDTPIYVLLICQFSSPYKTKGTN
jgi:hypothetical protein